MTIFKVGDRVRDISGHSQAMGLVENAVGKIVGQEEDPIYGWRIEWENDNGRCGPANWADIQLEHAQPETASPIREITRKEIVPGRYGAVHVVGLAEVPDCDDPNQIPITEVRIGIDASMTAKELDAAAYVLTQIATVLRENGNG